MIASAGMIDSQLCASLLNEAADGVVIIDHENVVSFFNSAAERIWGRDATGVIGKNVSVLVPAELAPHHDVLVDRHRRAKDERSVAQCRVVRVRRSDGALRWVNMSITPVPLSDGLGYAAFIRDVTEEHDLRSTIEQTLEQAIDAVVTIDHQNDVCFFNAAAERLWGYERSEVLGRNVKMLVPPEIRGSHDAMIAANRVTGRDKIVGTFREVEMVRSDGSRFLGSLSLSKIRISGRLHYTAFVRDVTTEVQDRRAQHELSELRERFALFLSHELRTPLAILDAQLRRAGKQTDSPEKVAHAFERMGAAVLRMRRLAENALIVGKCRSQGVDISPAPTDLRQLLELICVTRNEISPTHRVLLDVADTVPSCVSLDEGLIYSAIDNLVSNAVKYSPEAESISVSAAVEGRSLRISVRDEGRGIPEAEQPKIFDRFFRASTSDGLPGVGLGLNLVHDIVASHGGRIDVESTVGVGSAFHVILPTIAVATCRNVDDGREGRDGAYVGPVHAGVNP